MGRVLGGVEMSLDYILCMFVFIVNHHFIVKHFIFNKTEHRPR